MAKQYYGDEGCLCLELVESENDSSTFKLCNPESILRELKIECLHIGWKIISSCCRMLNGLETSRIVAAILEPQKTFGSGSDALIDDSYAKNCGVAWCDPRGGAEDRLPPSHKIRQETSSETSLYDTQKITVFTSQELELQVHERHVL